MGLFSKLLGHDFDFYKQKAENFMKIKQWGDAKLAWEEALAETKDVPQSLIDEAITRLSEVKDIIAKEHIKIGDRYMKDQSIDLAIEEFEIARDVAGSEELRNKAISRMDKIEARDAREIVDDVEEIDEDELYSALTGNWIDEQADELDGYGEKVKEAVLLLHDAKIDDSLNLWLEIEKESADEDSCYLYLEIGKVFYSAAKTNEAKDYVLKFLEKFEQLPEEQLDEEANEKSQRWEAELSARELLVRINSELEKWDEAEQELNNIIDIIPERTEGYLALGNFLRSRKRFEEAVEVLEKGKTFIGEIHPDIRLLRELGFAYKELNKKDEAISLLKATLDFFIARGVFDFDPAFAIPLAELYEEQKQINEAADIYRHLAQGSDVQNHLKYNLKAANLLIDLNNIDLAVTYLKRAEELAKDDPQKLEEVSNLIEKTTKNETIK